MRIIETVLGNEHDAGWLIKLDGVTVDVLELDQWDAQKNRFKKQSSLGDDVAVSLERGCFLKDGDVLFYDEWSQKALVARVKLCEVMVIDLKSLTEQSMGSALAEAVRLGHALGNQHWPAVFFRNQVYVPLTVSRAVMESMMHTHHFAGLGWHFESGEETALKLSPKDARKLFGGTDSHAHVHVQSEEEHSHKQAHEHSPEHPHDHSHPHKEHTMSEKIFASSDSASKKALESENTEKSVNSLSKLPARVYSAQHPQHIATAAEHLADKKADALGVIPLSMPADQIQHSEMSVSSAGKAQTEKQESMGHSVVPETNTEDETIAEMYVERAVHTEMRAPHTPQPCPSCFGHSRKQAEDAEKSAGMTGGTGLFSAPTPEEHAAHTHWHTHETDGESDYSHSHPHPAEGKHTHDKI